ncbi:MULTISPECIES: aldo/keto reductase [Myroides]|uniref:aldo/keto reductase n=1 Tax=Myroides TaxID=76831 RepID=UPI00130393FD|nr:aldo/keto reductase [Myroides phaeus]MEC4115611.1 aldo/keto reductase [Myroides phaeus]
MNTYKLGNGVLIPKVGFGTWQAAEGEEAVNSVKTALELGYRHIDTAFFYKNEVSVGKGIKASGVDRKEIFVTTKVWNSERGFEKALEAFDVSLKNLGLDYIDMFLIHWPASENQFENWKELNAETWRALEKLYADGKVRAIGVSNFYVSHLSALLETAKVKPMVNQIEFHPGMTQNEVVDFCVKNDILIEAWSPLGRGNVLDNEVLVALAAKYKVSVPQLCIRWIVQKGHLPLPKSVTPERIKANLDIYDFEISQEDIAAIDNLPYIGGSGLHPDKVDF